MDFLNKIIDFFTIPTHSRTMGVLTMLILISAVFLTVTVAQQQQTIKQRAADTSSQCNIIYGGRCYSNYSHCPDGFMQKGTDNAYCPNNGQQKCCVPSTITAVDYSLCKDIVNCSAITVEGTCPPEKTKCLSTTDFNGADTYGGKSLVCCELK